MADDPAVLEQAIHVVRPEPGNCLRPELEKSSTKCVALAENGDPGEASLEGIQDQRLEELHRVPYRNAPLLVMIGEV